MQQMFFKGVLVLLVLCPQVGLGDTPSSKEKLAIELIENTDLKNILSLYETLVKHKIIVKKREKSCLGDQECQNRWDRAQVDLLKDAQAESVEPKKILIRLLTKKYSEAQIDWLIKVYKTPLVQSFQKFVVTDESAEPAIYMAKYVQDKLDRYVQEKEKAKLKPGSVNPVSGTSKR